MIARMAGNYTLSTHSMKNVEEIQDGITYTDVIVGGWEQNNCYKFNVKTKTKKLKIQVDMFHGFIFMSINHGKIETDWRKVSFGIWTDIDEVLEISPQEREKKG